MPPCLCPPTSGKLRSNFKHCNGDANSASRKHKHTATAVSPAETEGMGEGQTDATAIITKTIYVTASPVADTACGSHTVYKTVTDKVTVTVPAGGSYVRHKKHEGLHYRR